MTECLVCRRDTNEAGHGACWERIYQRLIAEIARQQLEIGELRERLVDAGAMKRGER